MKKAINTVFFLFSCLIFINAQAFNADEVAKLKTFLTQTSSEEGKTNYEQLGITDIETVDWSIVDGLSWNSAGNLETILWASKQLSGDLDISDFSGLRKVHCEYNTLQSIDVTGSEYLSYMDCYNNELKTIDITTNANLDSFCCRYNQLKEIDLTKNIKLIYFCGSGNQFEYIDLSNNPELTTFYCANNKLQRFDASKNPKLHRTYLRTNQLTSLDFSGNNQLEYVTCYENQLETLNLSGCAALEYLTCRDNKLTELDASDSPKLTTLTCQNNQLKTLKIVAAKMETLFCEGNQLTFSSLPQIPSITDYTYAPQAAVALSYSSDKIDLSSVYEIDGTISEFVWTDKNGATVTPSKNENGVFAFDKSYVENTLTCKVTNDMFSDLTMEYRITLSSPVANNILEKATSIYAHAGSLYLKTEIPMTAKIHSITGALVRQVAVSEGESIISLPRGLYLVSLSNGSVRKVIIR